MCDGKSIVKKDDSCDLHKNIQNVDEHIEVTFYYYQYGSNGGILNIITENENETDVIWSNNKSVRGWVYGHVYLPIGKYQVR